MAKRNKDHDQESEASKFTRRSALQGAGAVVGATALGCGTEAGQNASPGGSTQASPEQLLAGFDTFVVLMMENRSFDHYFGARKLSEGRDVDGLTGDEVNLDQDGMPAPIHQLTDFVTPIDPPHEWDSSRLQFNNGKNDGFVTEYQATGGAGAREQVMGYYDRSDLPVHYALADEYVVCDRWFSSVMGPTWPNRYYLHCADAGGHITNEPAMLPSIFDLLEQNGVSSRYHYSNLPFTATYGSTAAIAKIQQFFDDAAAGALPNFVIVDPILTALNTVGNDDHPPADISKGRPSSPACTRRSRRARSGAACSSSSSTTSTAAFTTTCRRRPRSTSAPISPSSGSACPGS